MQGGRGQGGEVKNWSWSWENKDNEHRGDGREQRRGVRDGGCRSKRGGGVEIGEGAGRRGRNKVGRIWGSE